MDEILKIFSCFYCFSLFLPPISLSFLSHFFFSLDLIYSLFAVLCLHFFLLFTLHSFVPYLTSFLFIDSLILGMSTHRDCVYILQYHPNLRLSSWCWIFFQNCCKNMVFWNYLDWLTRRSCEQYGLENKNCAKLTEVGELFSTVRMSHRPRHDPLRLNN